MSSITFFLNMNNTFIRSVYVKMQYKLTFFHNQVVTTLYSHCLINDTFILLFTFVVDGDWFTSNNEQKKL